MEHVKLRWIVASLIALMVAAPAAAQIACTTERTELIKHLSRNYQESPVARGLTLDGAVLEVLASKAGSWTILITQPNSVSCVVTSGEAWDTVPLPIKGQKL